MGIVLVCMVVDLLAALVRARSGYLGCHSWLVTSASSQLLATTVTLRAVYHRVARDGNDRSMGSFATNFTHASLGVK